MRRVTIGVIVSAWSMLSAACGPESPNTADLVLSNATIVDVEAGELIPGRTIFIEDARIVDIISASRAVVPEGAQEVDATGLHVIPGLWDAHVHSATSLAWHFPLLVAHGVTSVRNMHTTVDTAIELITAIKRRVEAGEVIGPRFLANGPILDGYPPAWPGAVVVRTASEGRAVVDSLSAAGADFIKVYDNLTPETYHAIAQQAKQRGIPLDGHVPILVTAEEAAAAGQRTTEHMTGINLGCSARSDSVRSLFRDLLEDLPSLSFPDNAVAVFTLIRAASDSRDPALCDKTVRSYVEAGVSAVPTLAIEDVDPSQLIADSGRMDLLPAGVREQWVDMAAAGPGPIDAVWIGAEWTSPVNTRLLHEAGVPILAGTDLGNPFLVPGLSLHDELALLVREAGLSPLEALRAATLNPARTFGLADSLGTVAPGRLADLVLLVGNPLEDITQVSRIAGVVLRGRYLSRVVLDSLLAKGAAITN